MNDRKGRELFFLYVQVGSGVQSLYLPMDNGDYPWGWNGRSVKMNMQLDFRNSEGAELDLGA
jgi:hypothetical protein